MFSRRTLSVIKRELQNKLFNKSFIIMTLLVPLFLIGIIGIQTFIQSAGGEENANIIIASESGTINSDIENELNKQEFVKNGNYKIRYEIVRNEELPKYIDKNKQDILDEKLSGIVYIPSAAIKNKEIGFYAKNPRNNKLFDKMDDFINVVLINSYFTDKKLSQDDIAFATNNLNIKGYKVSEELAIREEGFGNIILSFLFTFLLYFSLLIFGSQMLTAVIEEKSNRIVEVLLSSLNSTELLTGKIIGTSITGLMQMVIWLIPVILLISTTIFILPPQFLLSISAGQLLYFLLNYFIALITYLGLYAAVGSIFSNAQDAQGGVWPLMLLIMIPFFIAIGMQSNPQNEIARIASMVPFAALIVMPARITLMEVPAWQFIIALIVNLTTMLLIFPLAGKIYRVGILSTGKKPTWGEVTKWLKYKY